MSARRDFELLINGAGVVGMSLALAAARSGMRVALLDHHPIAAHFRLEKIDSRVYALAPASIAWLQSLGVWSAVQARRAHPYTRMVVCDALNASELSFDAADLARQDLGAIVEESAVRAGLLEALEQADVELLGSTTIETLECAEGRVRLGLNDDRRLRGQLLIAADGTRSRLRTLLGVEVDAADFGQTALVATLRCEHPHTNTAWQRFQPGGPLALLPLGDGLSSMVWSMPSARAVELQKLAPIALAAAIERASDQRFGAIELKSAVGQFVLERHLATRLLGAGFVIIGDAARAVHPLAGLGLNLGLADARELISAIANLRAAGRDYTRVAALRPFERARLSESALVSAALSGINGLFRRSEPPLGILRGLGLGAVNYSETLKRLFAEKSLNVRFGAFE